MPKCKKCGQKMPKGFSYCGVCGADMVTGMIPWSKKEDTKETPKSSTPINNTNIPKVSMKPSQNIDNFINDTPKTQPIKQPINKVTPPPQQRFTPVENVQTAPKVEPINPVQQPVNKVTPPPQQRFTPVENVQTTPKVEPINPVQQPVNKVTPPPQQRFTPIENVQTAPKVEPINPVQQPVNRVTPPPQQRFTPVENVQTAPKVEPINPVQQPVNKVTPPPQQRFTPVENVQTAPKVEPINPVQQPVNRVTPPPQQRFTPVENVQTAPKVEPINPVQQPVNRVTPPPQQRFTPVENVQTAPKVEPINPVQQPINTQPQKPAYIPKPTPNATPIEMVKVPDVTNLNQDDARAKLESLGFKVSIVTENSSVIKPNLIISQGVRTGTEVAKGSEIKLISSVGTWSEWSIDKILDTNMYVIEQKKEFRFRSRTREIETHESSERNLPGYTCIDQKTVYSDWEDEGYYTTEDRPTSETCDISTNLIGFKYCGYSYVGSEYDINMCYSTKQSALIFNPNTKLEDWEYIETVLYQDIPSETVDWYPIDDMERTTPAGDSIDCNIKMTSYYIDGKRYAMKYGSLSTEWFLYHKRTAMETVYTYKREYFTEWSEWSDWTDKASEQDELNEVEARILYRARRKNSKEL